MDERVDLSSACSVWPTLLFLPVFLCLWFLLRLPLFAPSSLIPFHVTRGTNKGSKSGDGFPPDTRAVFYLSIPPRPSELNRLLYFLLSSLSLPWPVDHALHLSSPLTQQSTFFFVFNEGFIKFGATARNLIRASPTRDAIIRLHVIERANIVLLKWFQHELIVSDLWSAFNEIMPRFHWRAGGQRGGQVIAEARDILFSFKIKLFICTIRLSEWTCLLSFMIAHPFPEGSTGSLRIFVRNVCISWDVY